MMLGGLNWVRSTPITVAKPLKTDSLTIIPLPRVALAIMTNECQWLHLRHSQPLHTQPRPMAMDDMRRTAVTNSNQ